MSYSQIKAGSSHDAAAVEATPTAPHLGTVDEASLEEPQHSTEEQQHSAAADVTLRDEERGAIAGEGRDVGMRQRPVQEKLEIEGV